MKLDAKTIIALTGLVSVLLGGVEMRLQVSNIGARLDRIEHELRIERVAQGE
jgi:hypothetical protein